MQAAPCCSLCFALYQLHMSQETVHKVSSIGIYVTFCKLWLEEAGRKDVQIIFDMALQTGSANQMMVHSQ